MSLKEMQPDDLFFKFLHRYNYWFCKMIFSFEERNKCNDGTNAMQNTLLSGHSVFCFSSEVVYDSSNGVILSAPPSFISALIVKNSILNNFTHMAMNSDEQWSGAQSKLHYFDLFKDKIKGFL